MALNKTVPTSEYSFRSQSNSYSLPAGTIIHIRPELLFTSPDSLFTSLGIRTKASVSETNPTLRCSSSCNVAGRSVTERPQRSKRQTITTSISRWRAASINGSRAWRLAAPEPTSRDLHGYGPAAAGSIFAQHPDLHREGLLIIRGNACVPASQRLVTQDGLPNSSGVAAARTNSQRGVITTVPNAVSLGLMYSQIVDPLPPRTASPPGLRFVFSVRC